MELVEKNQGEYFKKHSTFLKIFPQYFAMNVQSFYEDPEICFTKLGLRKL